MTGPRELFDQFVMPSYQDWLDSPYEEHKCKSAVAYANDLAERISHHLGKSPRAYRTYLAEHECADFQLIWDIADARKHVILDRKPRRITRADQTGFTLTNIDEWDDFDSVSNIDGHGSVIAIEDDGTEHDLANIMSSVIDMFRRVLAANNL